MQYYIVAKDPKTYLEFSVTFQEIDKRRIFPAKDQAEALRLRAEAQLKAKPAEAAKEQARKALEDVKKAEDAKEAAKKAQDSAQQKKIDNFFHKQEKIKLRQFNLPDTHIDLTAALNIRKNDKVKLCNMNKQNMLLAGKTGTVELIVQEDLQRKGKFLFMVLLDDPSLNEQLAKKNVEREKSDKQTGHSRYGVLINDHFVICSYNQIERLVNRGNRGSASSQQSAMACSMPVWCSVSCRF